MDKEKKKTPLLLRFKLSIMIYIGIDCSKATFEVAIPKMKGYQSSKLGNVEEGFRKLLELLPADCQCVMEASGPYFCRLATFLCQHQVAVSVVNPLVVKRFAQMRLVRMKTDKADAKGSNLIPYYCSIWRKRNPSFVATRSGIYLADKSGNDTSGAINQATDGST